MLTITGIYWTSGSMGMDNAGYDSVVNYWAYMVGFV